MAQDRIAAGPAMLAASKAPKSQPDPMIDADSGEQQTGLADIALKTSVMDACHARMRAR